MADFELPFEKARALREWARQKDAELLPPELPAALDSFRRTVQVIKNEPLVVEFKRWSDTPDGDVVMRIITSGRIAKRKDFKEIISP